MKNINYTMPLFKKAFKRNFPKLIHLTKKVVRGYIVYEFWFVTQKAVISYVELAKRSVEILTEDFLNYGYVLEVLNDEHLEFVRYE